MESDLSVPLRQAVRLQTQIKLAKLAKFRVSKAF
jgi:hypothetical protein